jgi:hypothetical protein
MAFVPYAVAQNTTYPSGTTISIINNQTRTYESPMSDKDNHDLGIIDLCLPYKAGSTVFVDNKRVSCATELKGVNYDCNGNIATIPDRSCNELQYIIYENAQYAANHNFYSQYYQNSSK